MYGQAMSKFTCVASYRTPPWFSGLGYVDCSDMSMTHRPGTKEFTLLAWNDGTPSPGRHGRVHHIYADTNLTSAQVDPELMYWSFVSRVISR